MVAVAERKGKIQVESGYFEIQKRPRIRGKDVTNVFTFKLTFLNRGFRPNLLQDMKPVLTEPSQHICCHWNFVGGKFCFRVPVD